MVSKHKQKKRQPFKNYGKSNRELNALIEKKFQKFVKNKKRRKTEKELQHFEKIQIWMMKARRASPAWQKAWKVEKSQPPILNEN